MEESRVKTYCVTGATGYIGSWLVNSLLLSGHRVHATVRNPDKASTIFNSLQGKDRLSLFKADLQENGSFDEAIRGCDGVFHLAASMEFQAPTGENPGDVKTMIIDPAVRGTQNLLKSCLKSETVRRVVFTSTISMMSAKDESSGKWIHVVDESCQRFAHHILKTKTSGWAYALSKLSAEESAFNFSQENGIDLVSVICSTVGGPFLIPSVPSSIQVLLSQITGDPKYLQILSAVNTRMGSIALVHIEDICNAHIFLMGHPRSQGRYICCTQSCTMSELIECIRKKYPCSTSQRIEGSERDRIPAEISSGKIRELGFSFKYGVEDIINQTIKKCVDFGFLTKVEVIQRDHLENVVI